MLFTKKAVRFIPIAAVLILVLVVVFTSYGDEPITEPNLRVESLPETTTEPVPEGTFFLRCSQPEANRFSIQFVGMVPTNYVDYVGFEACEVYEDGTKGSLATIRLYTLYKEITDEAGEVIFTAADFGAEDGYLFVRTLEGLPTDRPGISYEISSYYVIDNVKTYTARQIFSLDLILYEHILSEPKPFEIKEESALIDVQKWVKYTTDTAVDEETGETSETVYYLGSSAPDEYGDVKMYICYAVPSANCTSVGIRYNFTETQGDNAGVNTTTRRVHVNTLYQKVYSETNELTVADFGLSEGYLVVAGLSDDLNTVTGKTYDLNLLAYYSRNAVESAVVNFTTPFSELLEDCIASPYSIPLGTYTLVPANYTDWQEFSESMGNAVGEGAYQVRVSDITNENGQDRFSIQLANAVPTRFAERATFVLTSYDKDGNPVGITDRAINVNTLYPSIMGNGDTEITSKDFGIPRGYIMTTRLNNLELDSEIVLLKIDAYYRMDSENIYRASLSIDVEELISIATAER